MNRSKKFGFTHILGLMLIASLLAACGTSGSSGDSSNRLSTSSPIKGTFATTLPTDEQGTPYIDYEFRPLTSGVYQFDLVSEPESGYDPLIRLYQGSTELSSNDDGGEGLNSRLVTSLDSGTYRVRVTRFGSSETATDAPFTLSAKRLSTTTSRRRSKATKSTSRSSSSSSKRSSSSRRKRR